MYGDRNRSGGDRGGGRFGGRDSGGSRFGRSDSRPRTMHQAVCAECGEPCEVPFRPSGGRPIYCSKHFEGREGGDSRRSDSRSFDRPRFDERPRYEDRGRSSGGEDSSQAISKILGELKSLNMKMDKLLSSVDAKPAKSKSVKVQSVAKKIEKIEEKAPEQIIVDLPPVE